MKVAVVGALGGMGSFFVRYFLARGDVVRGSDIAAKGRGGGLIGLEKTNVAAVEGCDVAILAVPIGRTLEVAKEVVLALRRGSTLVEMSSVKGKTLRVLRNVVEGRAELLSIHPLFGPALASSKGMKIAVIVGERGGARREVAKAESLFPEARIIPMGAGEHDRAMAVVLSLTHLVNLAYAGAAARFIGPEKFMALSTPNSSMQLNLAEAVLAQDARLSYAIQADNPYSKEVARAASRELEKVIEMVQGSDWKGFERHFSGLSKRYNTAKRREAIVREIYNAERGA